MGDLTELLERVKTATGPSRVIDGEVAIAIDGYERDIWSNYHKCGRLVGSVPAYTASIDAALALVERVLPEHRWLVNGPRWGLSNEATLTDQVRKRVVVGQGASPPLAILAVLLSALIAREEPPHA